MQAPSPIAAGFAPADPTRLNPRVTTAAVAVVAAHIVLLVIALTMREKPLPKPVEMRTITAELLSPPAPVAAPAAIESTPTPPPPKPVPVQHTKPKVQPRPTPVQKPTPTPLPEAAAPSQHEIAAPAADPAPATPTAPAAPAAPAAQTTGKPTLALSAPKNVSHLDCKISEPEYPALSRRRGESGTAYVRFVVGLTGKIENVELKKSSGFDRLDDAAMSALRSSACKPYLENGEPIRATYTQPFEFGLKE